MSLTPQQFADQARKTYDFRLGQLAEARARKGNGGPVVYSGLSDSNVPMAEYNWQCALYAAWAARDAWRKAVSRASAIQIKFLEAAE